MMPSLILHARSYTLHLLLSASTAYYRLREAKKMAWQAGRGDAARISAVRFAQAPAGFDTAFERGT